MTPRAEAVANELSGHPRWRWIEGCGVWPGGTVIRTPDGLRVSWDPGSEDCNPRLPDLDRPGTWGALFAQHAAASPTGLGFGRAFKASSADEGCRTDTFGALLGEQLIRTWAELDGCRHGVEGEAVPIVMPHLDVLFEVPMQAKPKGRPRHGTNPKTGKSITYTPKTTVKWEADFAQVAKAYLPRERIERAVRIDLLFVFKRPQGLARSFDPDGLIWKATRPDRDNLEKAVLDALAPFWTDDALVVCGEPLKCYAERDGRARVLCRMTDAGDGPTAEQLARFGLRAEGA
jgi:Holliday junction resolvase RusA-like endonuclease